MFLDKSFSNLDAGINGLSASSAGLYASPGKLSYSATLFFVKLAKEGIVIGRSQWS
jgi:hypothetical protein